MKVKAAHLCLTLWDPMHYVYGILQARILEWITISFSRGSSQPRDWTRSPALQADSLPAELPGKPKNTGVGSLSLLQQIFPTQELNRDLLHCRQILYQLSHQGSPSILYTYSVFITRDCVVKYMYSYFCFSISYIFFSILTLYINYSLWHWVILLINILPARWGSYVTLLQSSYL